MCGSGATASFPPLHDPRNGCFGRRRSRLILRSRRTRCRRGEHGGGEQHPAGPDARVVQRGCRRAAHHAAWLLCPSRYPLLASSQVDDGRGLARASYRGSFNDAGFRTVDAGHLFLAGQPHRLSLEGRTGQAWPRPGAAKPDKQLRIPAGYRSAQIPGGGSVPTHRGTEVVRAARVGATPTLVLRVAAQYPAGGVHSGHVLVLWNRGDFGYAVSLHFGGGKGRFRYSKAARAQTALTIARSARPAPALRR